MDIKEQLMGALLQVAHNDGSEGLFMVYDIDEVHKVLANIQKEGKVDKCSIKVDGEFCPRMQVVNQICNIDKTPCAHPTLNTNKSIESRIDHLEKKLNIICSMVENSLEVVANSVGIPEHEALYRINEAYGNLMMDLNSNESNESNDSDNGEEHF